MENCCSCSRHCAHQYLPRLHQWHLTKALICPDRILFLPPPQEIERSPVCSAVRFAAQNEQLCVYLRPRTRPHSYDRKGKRRQWRASVPRCAKLPGARACCSSEKDNKDVGSLNTYPTIFQRYHLSTPKHLCLMQWNSSVTPSQ